MRLSAPVKSTRCVAFINNNTKHTRSTLFSHVHVHVSLQTDDALSSASTLFYAAHKLRPPTCPPRGFQVPIFLSSLLPFFLSSLLPRSVPKLTASCERPELWRVCASPRVSGGVCLGAVCTCCVCRKAREFPWNTGGGGGGGNTDMFTWGSSRSPCLIYELYASPRGRKLASFF